LQVQESGQVVVASPEFFTGVSKEGLFIVMLAAKEGPAKKKTTAINSAVGSSKKQIFFIG
jgi:hypothetical protein